MTYASLSQHFLPLIKYILAFVIIFIGLPKLLLQKDSEYFLDSFFIGLIKMVFLLIGIVYLLVFLKLYEVISMTVLLLTVIYWKERRRVNLHSFADLSSRIQIRLYDVLDGITKPGQAKLQFKVIGTALKNQIKNHWVWFILFVIIFGFSSWLRFYDAFVHAAPPLSDSYVTLAWMKYISERILFHDGIYPQGFHIFLSVLSKFSANNPLYVLKYTGPLDGFLMIATIWFFVNKVTRSKSSAYFAAMAYGCTGLWFDQDLIRQAATNSQEFAMVFILPTVWYLMKYMEEDNQRDLYIAGLGLCVMGLVHSLIFVYTIWLCLAVVLSRILMLDRFILKKGIRTFGYGAVATALSLFPLGMGYLMGKKAHGSSLEYLSSVSNQITFSPIEIKGYILLAGLAACLILIVWERKNQKNAKYIFGIFVLFLSVMVFYWILPVVTQSIVLDSRKTMLALPFVAIAGGFLHAVLIRLFGKGKLANGVGIFITLASFMFVVSYMDPQPFIPQKMERDAAVEQYLKIEREFLPTSWIIVSQEEGYALVLGKGFHMFVGDFLKDIRSDVKVLTYKEDNRKLEIEEILIYYEKQVYTTPYETMKEIYARRDTERLELIHWLQDYNRNTGNLKIYYEDENLIIYWIHNEKLRKEEFDDLWNE